MAMDMDAVCVWRLFGHPVPGEVQVVVSPETRELFQNGNCIGAVLEPVVLIDR